MIERILPAHAAVVEARGEELDVRLFPEEEMALGRAVQKRRREFTTGRACARAALATLGFDPLPIASGPNGEPCWPQGVVGSITHCEGYRACAAGRSVEILSIGIDAEPNAALPHGLLTDIARPEELPGLERLALQDPSVRWDRLLFSAKESIYKAWFPLAKRWLGFENAVLTVDAAAGTFAARLLIAGPAHGEGQLRELRGRWMVSDGIILTAIALEPCTHQLAMGQRP
jgi:4'-phosphopantetheinyl transferase EntD